MYRGRVQPYDSIYLTIFFRAKNYCINTHDNYYQNTSFRTHLFVVLFFLSFAPPASQINYSDKIVYGFTGRTSVQNVYDIYVETQTLMRICWGLNMLVYYFFFFWFI